jgi:hypothetical protein
LKKPARLVMVLWTLVAWSWPMSPFTTVALSTV